VSDADTPPARPQPPLTAVSQPFWDATRDHRYLLQWCVDCERAVHFPRSFCPHCSGSALEWRPATGRGTVYSYTVDHRPPRAFGVEPYVVALVDLDEGVRVMTNIVGTPPGAVRVGLPVELTWEPLADGRNLPLFQPDQPGPGGP
jgi:uncharacterized protein